MKQAKSRFRKRTANVLILTIFFLVVVLAFAALSVDVGYMHTVKARMQAAADSAAFAGAIALADGDENVVDEVITFAHYNRAYADEFTMLESDVVLGVWDDDSATFTPISEENDAEPNAVRASCHRTADRGNPAGLFFARVLGNDYCDIVATATARYDTTKCGIIVGLSYVSVSGTNVVDSYESDDGPYFPGDAASNGNVCSNGNIVVAQYAAIKGDAHPGPTGTVMDSSTIGVSGDTSPLTEPLDYPVADSSEAQATNDNGSIPNTSQGINPVNALGQLNILGPYHLELPPGTYYFTRVFLASGATIGVSGETIMYVDGDVYLTGGSVVNNTMIPQNLQLYVNGTTVGLSGFSEFYGVVYAPRSRVMRSGTTHFYGSIIANQLMFSGGGGLHADDSLDLEILDKGIKRTSLVD